MGIVIDTCIFIEHERGRREVTELVSSLSILYPGRALAASVITITELTHGVYRSKSPAISRRRQLFINQLESTVRLIPVSLGLSRLIGQLDGQLTAQGQRIELGDLIIAATAIQRRDSVLTLNTRHFTQIPGVTTITP